MKPEKTKRASAMHLKINGLNLHLEDRGNSDGLPLVFLHSWAGSTHSWKYVVAALPNRLRRITIDQRGWGRSESHSSGFQLADLASDAKEVVKALKLDRYVLVGHGRESSPTYRLRKAGKAIRLNTRRTRDARTDAPSA
jgi:alpha/beta hydrolase fold